jgi:Family of unknown function (DUF6069)
MRRVIAIASATVGAVAVWTVSQLAGAQLTVQPSGQQAMKIGLPIVVLTAVVAGLAGWALRAALQRLTKNSTAVWTLVASAVLLLSLGMPLTVQATGATQGWLIAMHVAVGAILIPMMRSNAVRGAK